MRPIRTFVTLLVLALLPGSVPTAELHLTRAADLHLNTASAAHIVESPSFNFPESTVRSTPFSRSSTPSVIHLPDSDWHVECVDCPMEFRGGSLRLDSGGHPHIAYGGDHLYHAWYDGAQWHRETVDASPSVGSYASLALDGSDRPRISYFDWANSALKYAWHDGSVWHVETVGGEGYVGLYTSLALNGSLQPHISYYDGTSYDLKYAWYDGAEWHVETVDTEGSEGCCSSLALDGSGRPHVSYSVGIPGYALKYAWRDEAGWHVETVDSGGYYYGVSRYTSLALDGADRPHISYRGGRRYAWHDGTGWRIETVSTEGWVGEYTSLALDGADRPRISYYDGSNHALKCARRDGAEWKTETVDSELITDWMMSASLALDQAGMPHISYFDWANNALKYAWHDGTAWRIEMVDTGGRVGLYTSLALDGADRPHISYTGGGLRYAWHDGANWQIETVDSDAWVGYYTSLALDGADRPHISYTGGGLKYAWHDGAAWHIETVDSGYYGDVGSHTSLALDGAGRPHISYYHYTGWDAGSLGSLKYAYHDGVIWHIETVDSGYYGGVGYATSLALDRSGRPHISYRGLSHVSYEDELKYAWHDGPVWHVETVDTGEEMGGNTSLALDASDRPHISYFDEINEAFRYTWYDGTGWHIETVDRSVGEEGRYSSLALDASDRPHVSYFDEINEVLRYAWRGGAGWHIETVDCDLGEEGGRNSLALDSAGRPHIAQCDDTSGDLKYAWRTTRFISLDKQVTPRDGLRNNDTLTYTLTLSNSGLSVRLWDPLPAAVQYVSDSITSTVTPPAVYSPTAHAVVWEGTLPTDTVQVIRLQVTPGITGTQALSLSSPIVNTAWLTDTRHDRSVSAMVIVNGWHIYLPLVMRRFP